MFGDNNQNDQTQNGAASSPPTADHAVIGTPFTMDNTPTQDSTAAPAEPTSAPVPDIATPAPELPAAPAPDEPATSPAASGPEPAAIGDSSGTSDDLINIKQQALQQLQPLVSHLEQTPEEKFKTTMMMLQASDDQSLVKTAYDTAQQIKDEKQRAQALLDIINEINYFTNQKEN